MGVDHGCVERVGAAAGRPVGGGGRGLLLGARRVERLEGVTAATLKAGAAEAHFHFLDVSKTASVEEFVAWAREKMVRTPSSAVKSTREDKKTKIKNQHAAGGVALMYHTTCGAFVLASR